MPSNECPIITGIIFSKNRAMQLEATLRSFFIHCLDPELVSIHVVYMGSSKFFISQYHQLQKEYPDVNFIRQGIFKQDVFFLLGIPQSPLKRFFLRFFPANSNKFILFLVDDNIFVRDFQLSDACSTLKKEPDSLGFSLQLGTNINYCYPLELSLKFPEYAFVVGDVIKFRWTDAGDGLNYPLEVSSSIYRQKELINLISRLEFTNPNTLESQMAGQARFYRYSHPTLLCYQQSVTFCNPINKVQNTYNNKAGEKQEYSPDALAKLFDEGYRLNISSYRGFIPNAGHQEVELQFEKRGNP